MPKKDSPKNIKLSRNIKLSKNHDKIYHQEIRNQFLLMRNLLLEIVNLNLSRVHKVKFLIWPTEPS